MFHPLLTTGLALDVVGLLLCLAGSIPAARIIVGRLEQSAQYALHIEEKTSRKISFYTRSAFLAFVLGTLAWVVAIAVVLPGEVRGAMCATGVMRATHGLGAQVLLLKGLGLLLLYCWYILDALQRSIRQAGILVVSARVLLLTVPVFVLTVVTSLRAVLRLDSRVEVDCCSKILENAQTPDFGMFLGQVADWFWPAGWIVFGGVVGLIWFRKFRRKSMTSPRVAGLLGLTQWIWVLISAWALVYVVGPLCYGDPKHHCAWCLMSPRYGMIGFVLFGALLVTLAESLDIYVCTRVTAAWPDYLDLCRFRIRRAFFGIWASMSVFLLSAGWSVLIFSAQSG